MDKGNVSFDEMDEHMRWWKQEEVKLKADANTAVAAEIKKSKRNLLLLAKLMVSTTQYKKLHNFKWAVDILKNREIDEQERIVTKELLHSYFLDTLTNFLKKPPHYRYEEEGTGKPSKWAAAGAAIKGKLKGTKTQHSWENAPGERRTQDVAGAQRSILDQQSRKADLHEITNLAYMLKCIIIFFIFLKDIFASLYIPDKEKIHHGALIEVFSNLLQRVGIINVVNELFVGGWDDMETKMTLSYFGITDEECISLIIFYKQVEYLKEIDRGHRESFEKRVRIVKFLCSKVVHYLCFRDSDIDQLLEKESKQVVKQGGEFTLPTFMDPTSNPKMYVVLVGPTDENPTAHSLKVRVGAGKDSAVVTLDEETEIKGGELMEVTEEKEVNGLLRLKCDKGWVSKYISKNGGRFDMLRFVGWEKRDKLKHIMYLLKYTLQNNELQSGEEVVGDSLGGGGGYKKRRSNKRNIRKTRKTRKTSKKRRVKKTKTKKKRKKTRRRRR
jgi:hypothetical protein